MRIRVSDLHSKLIATLTEPFGAENAAQIAEYLLWAEMSGKRTQGILKLTGNEALQRIKPLHPITIERETTLSRIIDAGGWPAPLVSYQATDAVIEKAKAHGFGIVGVRNTFSSNGSQAFYAERIAKSDLIGIVMARSPATVAPFGSIAPFFGTNPIGFSFPTEGEPLVFDMATSAMTYYGLILAQARGETIPADMAIDSAGNFTADPAAAMKGALLSFDRSYKGSGLGTQKDKDRKKFLTSIQQSMTNCANGRPLTPIAPEGETRIQVGSGSPVITVRYRKFKAGNSDSCLIAGFIEFANEEGISYSEAYVKRGSMSSLNIVERIRTAPPKYDNSYKIKPLGTSAVQKFPPPAGRSQIHIPTLLAQTPGKSCAAAARSRSLSYGFPQFVPYE